MGKPDNELEVTEEKPFDLETFLTREAEISGACPRAG